MAPLPSYFSIRNGPSSLPTNMATPRMIHHRGTEDTEKTNTELNSSALSSRCPLCLCGEPFLPKPAGRVAGVVGQDHIRARPLDARQDFQRHPSLVDPALR